VLAVQVLTLGIEERADRVREALRATFAPRGAGARADAPVRTLEGLPLVRETWWGEVPPTFEVEVEGFSVESICCTGRRRGCSSTSV
jgi:23S rRNA (cytosine1962-C5)-methyltransferase